MANAAPVNQLESKVSSKRRTRWAKVPGFIAYKEYVWPNLCVCCFGSVDTTSSLVSELDRIVVDSGLAKIGKSGNVQIEFDSYNRKCFATMHVPYCKDCKKHDRWGNAARGMIGCAAGIFGFFGFGLLIVLIFVGPSELKHFSFRRLPLPSAIVLALLLGGHFLKRVAAKKRKESCPTTTSRLLTPFPVLPYVNNLGVGSVEFAQEKYAKAFAQANQLVVMNIKN